VDDDMRSAVAETFPSIPFQNLMNFSGKTLDLNMQSYSFVGI